MNDPALPVTTNMFWRGRIHDIFAKGKPIHKVIYDIDDLTWSKIQYATAVLFAKQIKPEMTVLDVGCGIGSSLECLQMIGRANRYQGLDASEDLINLARLRFPGYDFRVQDCSDLSCYPDNHFDIVICREVLEMLENNIGKELRDKVANECRRVGKQFLIFEYTELLAGKVG